MRLLGSSGRLLEVLAGLLGGLARLLEGLAKSSVVEGLLATSFS